MSAFVGHLMVAPCIIALYDILYAAIAAFSSTLVSALDTAHDLHFINKSQALSAPSCSECLASGRLRTAMAPFRAPALIAAAVMGLDREHKLDTRWAPSVAISSISLAIISTTGGITPAESLSSTVSSNRMCSRSNAAAKRTNKGIGMSA